MPRKPRPKVCPYCGTSFMSAHFEQKFCSKPCANRGKSGRGPGEPGWNARTLDLDVSWKQHARCQGVDPELFFPSNGDNGSEAKKVCVVCPVRLACLNYALEAEETFGLWGGKSQKELRVLRRQRRAKGGRVVA